MTHRECVERSVAEMREQGVGPWISAPPLHRLLWACGFTVPPPAFMPVKSAALLMGFTFAVIWGTTMWLWMWSGETHPSPFAAVFASAGGGTAFGFTMAWFIARGRGRWNLPSWRQYLSDGGPSGGRDPARRR